MHAIAALLSVLATTYASSLKELAGVDCFEEAVLRDCRGTTCPAPAVCTPVVDRTVHYESLEPLEALELESSIHRVTS